MRQWWKTGSVLLLAALVVAVDQYAKAWIRQALPYGAVWSAPWAETLPWLRIVHWSNPGAAFGLFQQAGPLFTALAVVVVLAMLFHLPQMQREPWLMRLGLGLVLGGALGNLVDRLTQGVVTDFIAVGAFPVFNLADASITVGAVAILLAGWASGQDAEAGQETLTEEPEEKVPHE
ncbi:MAG TPA: signal peptidase II [Anaerolineae bacterium]|nr:signal peptidase II [Anaerolineae bacterium]HID84741.1 signal peptidase II [Anaerolineales bacterium]HIQ08301.1 signal peptidase II [Anaerolineaceae bacterium]